MLKEALIKSHKRDWSAFVPCLYDQSRCGRLARDSTCLDRHKSAPVPRKRRSFIGLRQLQRLPRCAPCQGTYLGCGATPCVHLHLTQHASRDLISASLSLSGRAPLPNPVQEGEGSNVCFVQRYSEGSVDMSLTLGRAPG